MARDSVDTVMDELRQWGDSYRSGGVRMVALVKPALAPGEKWSARVLPVGAGSVQREELAGFRSAVSFNDRMTVTGLGFATDRRAFVARFRTVKREWKWADVHSVRALDDFQGVVIDTNPDSGSVDVLATRRTPTSKGTSLMSAASAWLRFEGTFADFRGELDSWMEGVPDRLRSVYRG